MSNRSATGKVQITAQCDLLNTLNNTGKSSSSQVGAANIINDKFTVSGVKTGQINRAWENTDISLAAGATLTINMNGFGGQDIGAGAGNDALGIALDMGEIVLIVVKNTSTEDGTATGGPMLEVKPSTASGWTAIGTHTVALGGAIPPGGCLIKYAPGEGGFDIDLGTADHFDLVAPGNAVKCSVTIFGRNDDDESSSTSTASSQSSSLSSVSSSSVSSSISSSLSSSSSS